MMIEYKFDESIISDTINYQLIQFTKMYLAEPWSYYI